MIVYTPPPPVQPVLIAGTTAELVAAMTAAQAAGGGTIQLYAGATYGVTAAQVTFANKTGITIEGVHGMTGGAGASSIIEYTGSGSSTIIPCGDSTGCGFKDVEIRYTNSAFTGKLLDCASTVQANYLTLERVLLKGVTAAGQTARLIDVNQAINVTFNGVQFNGAGYGVYGRASSATTDFANNIEFLGNCQWIGQAVMPVYNPGTAWTFESPSCQALQSGDVGFVSHATGVLCKGFEVSGGATYDQTTTNAGTWFKLAGTGISIHGMKSSGRQVSNITFVTIDENGSDGVEISGNALDNMYRGIDFLATTGHMHGAWYSNGFANLVAGWLAVAATGGTVPKGITFTDSSAAVGKPKAYFWDDTVASSTVEFDGVHKLYNNGGNLLTTATGLQVTGSIFAGTSQTAGTQLYGTAAGSVGGLQATGSNATVDLYLDAKGTTGIVRLAPSGTNGGVMVGKASGNVGFYGTTPIARPAAIAGSRSANAALADLLTKLATLGLITDSTTA